MTLHFEIERGRGSTSMHRMDVVCFVGLVARRAATPTPPALAAQLADAGWVSHPESHAAADADALLQVPVPIDDWQVFDALFEWDRRPLFTGGDAVGDTYLGAAVRAFFAHGGRRCVVVRVGDPGPLDPPEAARLAALDAVVPGVGGGPPVERGRRATWRGLGLLLGLDEVSAVVLPDLCALTAQVAPPLALETPVPIAPPVWDDCVDPDPAGPGPRGPVAAEAPYMRDADGISRWRQAVSRAGQFLADNRRDVTLVAALPRVARETPFGVGFHRDPLGALVDGGAMLPLDEGGVSGRFVQLCWPWIEWSGAARLPSALAPPEGVVAGLIARNALTRGAFHSAAGSGIGAARRLDPALGRAQLLTRHPAHGPAGALYAGLQERVTLLGPTPRGLALLSDVTTSGEARWRQANVARVFAVVLRALRQLGENAVFEPSGPQTWDRVRTLVSMVLRQLWEADGLDGRSPAEAYSVVCDRSTMSQSDLDAGRLIAVVSLRPAAAIEHITVQLVLDEGGRITRLDPVPTSGRQAVA